MSVSPDILKKHGYAVEEWEQGRDATGNIVYAPSGFPKAIHHYHLTLEDFSSSVEEFYFWCLEEIRHSQGYHDIIKITDLFSASEHSSFFGSAQQRLGMQQEKVSMFLATIGKMVKELFQLVREIRVLDERLSYYKDSMNPDSKSRESAEITLKGIWIDLVEQGAKNPASVYGMARELQFTTLPDLFFSIHPIKPELVDKEIDKLDFNRKVKEVLKRKLRQFLEWKKSTYKELQVRRRFTLKYLRQHFNIIRMYMQWVRPYLRNVKRLQMKDSTGSPDLISAFEGTLIELEFMARKKPQHHGVHVEQKTNKHVYAVQIMYFNYRTKPSMNYFQEYQKGPLHIGSVEIKMLGYTWTEDEIQDYLNMKAQEDFELLSVVDESVKAAMEALGDELEAYLRDAGEDITFSKGTEKKEKEPQKPSSMADPFIGVAKGFTEIFSFGKTAVKTKDGKKIDAVELARERSVAKSAVKGSLWQTYKNFKKTFGLLAW